MRGGIDSRREVSKACIDSPRPEGSYHCSRDFSSTVKPGCSQPSAATVSCTNGSGHKAAANAQRNTATPSPSAIAQVDAQRDPPRDVPDRPQNALPRHRLYAGIATARVQNDALDEDHPLAFPLHSLRKQDPESAWKTWRRFVPRPSVRSKASSATPRIRPGAARRGQGLLFPPLGRASEAIHPSSETPQSQRNPPVNLPPASLFPR